MESQSIMSGLMPTAISMNHLYVAAGIAVLYTLILKITPGGSWRAVKGEPPLLAHWIPILGHVIRFAIDKRAFFLWAE